MKIIAVDFDGCLCGGKWPDIGAPRQQVIKAYPAAGRGREADSLVVPGG